MTTLKGHLIFSSHIPSAQKNLFESINSYRGNKYNTLQNGDTWGGIKKEINIPSAPDFDYE